MVPRITNSGIQQMIYAMDGVGINFSKIVIGSGDVPDDYKSLEDLVNPVAEIEISSIDTEDEYALITAVFDNSEIEESFSWTEVGIYCSNPYSTDDEELDDVLYAYGHYQLDEDETATAYIPEGGSEILEIHLKYSIYIGEAEEVTATLSDSSYWATKEELEVHTHPEYEERLDSAEEAISSMDELLSALTASGLITESQIVSELPEDADENDTTVYWVIG